MGDGGGGFSGYLRDGGCWLPVGSIEEQIKTGEIMKLLRKEFAILLATAMLSACSLFADPPKTTQDVIVQARVTIAAIAQQVAENVRTGVMTSAERDSAVVDLKKYQATVDQAETLLASGDAAGAQQKINLINTVLLDFSKRMAEKARQPQ